MVARSLHHRASARRTNLTGFVAAALCVGLVGSAEAQDAERGLALLTSKVLVAAEGGPSAINHATVLVRGGKIQAVGKRDEVQIPTEYEILDLGDLWLAPGLIDLHSHVGGSRRDINDMVFQTNPGLRVSPTVIPANNMLDRAVGAGVTTILYIPGSGTNIGGQGVLMKTGFERYEDAVVRDPGSLKIAQGDNPTRWGFGMGRITMAWNLKNQIRRGIAYAKDWIAYERDGGTQPQRDINLDVFRDLVARKTQVSTHTQYYHLVLTTIIMLARDFGFATYIDHGSFDSYLAAPLAIEHGVAAILGPREVMYPRPPRFDTDGRVIGSAWGFQQAGHQQIGFNTDAPVVPQEELQLQAAMGVRYGLDTTHMESVRGLTIVPAVVAGIEDTVGSIEAGKDADLIVVTGDPVDPRTSVEMVFIRGRKIYDTREERRRW